jgi:PIN domain nuclease of toxin-antitoxin system
LQKAASVAGAIHRVADIVLDASAVLAFLHRESGREIVEEYAGGARLSAVNLAEVRYNLADDGMSEENIDRSVGLLRMEVIPFDEDLAQRGSRLRRTTRHLGLSLGDRACLALAKRLGLPVLTADRSWAKLDIGVEVRLIR